MEYASLNGALPKISALRMLFESEGWSEADQLGSFSVVAGQDTL